MRRYLINLLIGIDQLLNTLLGGDPDETISSRAGKRDKRRIIPTAICWLLDKLDPGHCRRAIEHDEGKDEVV